MGQSDIFTHLSIVIWIVLYIALIVFYLVVILICIAGIVGFVMSAMGVYRMAVRKGLKYPWFAWIPIFCHDYVYAQLIGENLNITEKKIKRFPLVYALVILISFYLLPMLILIPIIGYFFMFLIPLILLPVIGAVIYVRYRFFLMFDKEKVVPYTLLGIIWIVFSILVFSLQKKAFIDSEGVVVEGT